MFKTGLQLLSRGLLVSLLLLFMAACGSDDDSDDYAPWETPPPAADADPADPPADQPAEEPDPVEPPAEEPQPEPPANDIPDNAKSIDDTCIVWKPVSEGDGRLVVLLTTNYGNPPVYILDENGNEIEKGRYVGRTNGNRATYRFNRPGRGYPNPSYLEVGNFLYRVNNPGTRHSC